MKHADEGAIFLGNVNGHDPRTVKLYFRGERALHSPRNCRMDGHIALRSTVLTQSNSTVRTIAAKILASFFAVTWIELPQSLVLYRFHYYVL